MNRIAAALNVDPANLMRAESGEHAQIVAELGALVSRRDRKLEYLYGRAIDYAQDTLAARVRRADRWTHVRGLPGRAVREAGRVARALLAGSSAAEPQRR